MAKIVAYLESYDSGVVEDFHTNTIEVFDGSLEKVSPLLRKGNIVLSSALHECAFIVDGETERVVWNWFGPWLTGIHQPTFLPDGRWLLFDNTMYFNLREDAASQVWEFYNPKHTMGDSGDLIATLFQLERHSKERLGPLVESQNQPLSGIFTVVWFAW